ncbi:10802_t:CDS:2 [Gigaspora margarita]|uniref:10802_t:CDS:1 n=1 Tax=Gigaspora margarita TaxID=4874 RepID=A0ABM8W3N5_GIGMA|nr:10802_t:CDS:2 [Gigaspora margarita]
MYINITKIPEYERFIFNSSKLALIFFHSTYCIYSQIVLSAFAELSSRYDEHAKFALVYENAFDVSDHAQVHAFPTFVFSKNGVEIKRLIGADRNLLIRLLLKHIKLPNENEENYSNSFMKVNKFIKTTQVECLNQQGHIQNIFRNDESYLESNDGAELMISIPFNQAIDLHSIKIVPSDIDHVPKEIKFYVNRPFILSFDDTETTKETHLLEFTKADYDINTIIPLKSVKFQKITNVVLFIKNNISDKETTAFKELLFFGTILESPYQSCRMLVLSICWCHHMSFGFY